MPEQPAGVGSPIKLVIRGPQNHELLRSLKAFTERRAAEIDTFLDRQHAALVELAQLVEARKSIGPGPEIWDECHRLAREAKLARERGADDEAAAKREECRRMIEQDSEARFDPELDQIRRLVVLAMGHLGFVINAESRGDVRCAIVEAAQFGVLRERLNEILATKLVLWREFCIPVEGEILQRAILRELEYRDSMTFAELVPIVWPGEKYGSLETERYRKAVNRANGLLRRHAPGYRLKISRGIIRVCMPTTPE